MTQPTPRPGRPAKNDLLLRAVAREKVERTPVWLMRQAGRYMEEYRKIRETISFMDLCRNVEVATEVSLQPYKAFRPDAVIMFSDILVPLTGMGIDFTLDHGGPKIHDPIRTQDQVDRLTVPPARETTPYVFDIIRSILDRLDGEAPLIGFAGGPFTLAVYSVEGHPTKSFDVIKSMAYNEPAILHGLLAKTADMVADYLAEQVAAGVHIVQLFDTWAGILSPADYETFALPYQKRALSRIAGQVPTMLYVNGSGGLLELMIEAGVDVISVDWKTDIATVMEQVNGRVAVQGNLDPCALLGPKEILVQRTEELLKKAGPVGHILNLGHGVLPPTPRENVAAFIETARTHAWTS